MFLTYNLECAGFRTNGLMRLDKALESGLFMNEIYIHRKDNANKTVQLTDGEKLLRRQCRLKARNFPDRQKKGKTRLTVE